jgi:hypothetical protein
MAFLEKLQCFSIHLKGAVLHKVDDPHLENVDSQEAFFSNANSVHHA